MYQSQSVIVETRDNRVKVKFIPTNTNPDSGKWFRQIVEIALMLNKNRVVLVD